MSQPSTPPPPPPPSPSSPSAGSGATKWVLFGCGGCLGLLIVACIAVFAIAAVAFEGVKRSTPYQEALHLAQNSPAVQEALGAPVKDTFFLVGSVKLEGDEGEALISAPLVGSKAKGTLTVEASRSRGTWQFHRLEVVANETGQFINLLEEGTVPPPVEGQAAHETVPLEDPHAPENTPPAESPEPEATPQ